MKINTLLEQVELLEMDLSQLKVVGNALKPRVAKQFNLEFNVTKHAFDRMIEDAKKDPSRNVDAADFFRSMMQGLEDSQEYRKIKRNKHQEAELLFRNNRTGLNIAVSAKYHWKPKLPEKLHLLNVITVLLKDNYGLDDYPNFKLFEFRV